MKDCQEGSERWKKRTRQKSGRKCNSRGSQWKQRDRRELGGGVEENRDSYRWLEVKAFSIFFICGQIDEKESGRIEGDYYGR